MTLDARALGDRQGRGQGAARAEPSRKYHAGMTTLGRIYATDSASLSDFMRSVQEQIDTQSTAFDDSA